MESLIDFRTTIEKNRINNTKADSHIRRNMRWMEDQD